MKNNRITPGPIILMGSGETSPGSGAVFEEVAKQYSPGLRIAIMETPAGFELNSERVARRVGEYLQNRLQNYHPVIDIIPARKRGTDFSPENEAILEPLYSADIIFLGPGSPSYTARQLIGSLAYDIICGKQRAGSALVLASAATIAFGCQTMPVYEIYKAGMELHWQPGLNFMGPFGLDLVIIPHWNNTEGGAELDTSHCFMGASRFSALRKILPCKGTILGIDEHTSIWINIETEKARIYGKGSIHIIHGDLENSIRSGEDIPISKLGAYQPIQDQSAGLNKIMWTKILTHMEKKESLEIPSPTPEVLEWLAQRDSARRSGDYVAADQIRDKIEVAGWKIKDTSGGSELERY